MGTRRFHLRTRPTRATGWALIVIGGYAVLGNLVHGLGSRVLWPGGHSQPYLIGGVVIILIGLAVAGQVEV